MLVLNAKSLSSENIAHGFFGRQGGVSEGIYASLNCGIGSNDERVHVIENRRRVVEAIRPDATLLTLHQIHSAHTETIDTPWEIGQGPQADAMVTNKPGLALGILTADCAPVLLADHGARVVGAAHAGWKGAAGGVIESVVAAMEALGARRERIASAIGPCISQQNYEVGAEFRETFVTADPAYAKFFIPADRDAHWRFDLEGFVAVQLAASGIANVERLSACTYACADDFFSYRRATHRGEKDYGRQVSITALTE